jgi:hypothetical protein
MIQIQKMPRKQAIRGRMHSGIVDSSKNCAGRDFKTDASAPGRIRMRTHKELDDYAMSDTRPVARIAE